LITTVAQRWRDHRTSYRPAGEKISTSSYEVAELESDSIARAFVESHHYSGSYPAARFRFGLYRGAELAGVAVFSVPVNDKALAFFPGAPLESVELGRFVLLDSVPGNGETWFLARAFDQLRAKGLLGVLSFSDPLPRATAAGAPVFRGHVGTIYQAFNGRYLGRATARTLHLLPDARVFSARTAQKIRTGERGWRYAVDQLVAAGAAPLEGDRTAWLRRELARVTRCVRHPGNHRYAWGLTRQVRRHLPEGRPYPKAFAG
jgi:hypothetical protein